MRGPIRLPIHPAPPTRSPSQTEEDDDPDRFVNRPCYEFNHLLMTGWNDRHCEHCRHFLTAHCPHIDEFLDDVEDLTPE